VNSILICCCPSQIFGLRYIFKGLTRMKHILSMLCCHKIIKKCHSEYTVLWIVTPYGNILGYHSFGGTLPQQEVARSFEPLVSYHISTWRHNSEVHDLNLQRRENLKSRTGPLVPRNFFILCCFCFLNSILLRAVFSVKLQLYKPFQK